MKAKLNLNWLLAKAAEVFRFGIAGLTTEGAYFILLWLVGQFADWAMWSRATLAYLGSIGVNYAMQRSFTFRSQKKHTHSGPRYLAVQFGGLLINSGVLWLTVDTLHAPFIPSQIGAIALLAVWSYFGMKLWAF